MLFVIGSDNEAPVEETRKSVPEEAEGEITERTKPVWSQPRFMVIAGFGLVGAVLGAALLPGGTGQGSRMMRADFIPYRSYGFMYPAMALLGLILGSGLGRLLVQLIAGMSRRWERMDVGDRVDLILGGFAGIVASIPFLFIFQGVAAIATPFLFTFLII